MVLETSWREPSQSSSTQALDPQNPWPGLAAYDEKARAFFHGRKVESLELARLIRLSPLTALYGKSGLGKSSLLQAGLFPILRSEHYLPVYLCLDFSTGALDPLEQLRELLIAAFERSEVDYPAFEPEESVWEYLHRPGLELWSKDNYPLTPVLVFDQFEEIFSRGGTDKARIDRVFEGLADLIENRIPPEIAGTEATARRARLDVFSQTYRIVLSFREDFLPQLKSWESSVPSLLKNCLRLESMSRDTAVDAVELSGREVLEPGVAAMIVDLVSRDPAAERRTSEVAIEPVLLSLCCTRLNGRRQGRRPISAELVEAEGSGILRGFYEEAMADEGVAGTPDVAAFVEEYLIQGSHFRGDYPRDEAVREGLITEAQLGVLTAKHRLLRIAPHPDTVRIELIHDRLVPVVSAARSARKARQHAEALERTAAEQRQRAEERDRAAKKLKRYLILVGVLAGLGAALAVAVIMSVLSGHAREEAKRRAAVAEQQRLTASFRALIASAINQAGTDPELGVLLALRAMDSARHLDLDAKRQATDTLSRVTAAVPLWPAVRLCESGVQYATAALSADGANLAIDCHGADGTRVFRGADFKPTSLISTKPNVDRTIFASSAPVSASLLGSDRQTIEIQGAGGAVSTVVAPAPVRALAVSADGTRLAAGGDSGAWLWELGVGVAPTLVEISGPARDPAARQVVAVALDAKGGILATANADHVIRLWDAHTGALRRIALEGHEHPIASIEFGPTGTYLVSASQDGTARLWELGTGQARVMRGHANSVFSASMSRDGRKIVTGSADSTVRLWDSESGQEIARFHGDSVINFVRFADEDRRVISVSWDGTVAVWSAGGHTREVVGQVFVAGGHRLVTASRDGSVRLWDVASAEPIRVVESGYIPFTVLVQSGGESRRDLLAAALQDGSMRTWDLASADGARRTICCAEGQIVDLDLEPGGKYVVSASNRGVDVWSTEGTAPARSLLVQQPFVTNKVAVSPDGAWVAAASEDGRLWLWKTSDWKQEEPLAAHTGKLFELRFSPDSKSILTTSQDNSVKVFDLETRKETFAQANSDLVIGGTYLGSDDRIAVSLLSGEVVVWDVAAQLQVSGPPPHAGSVSFDVSQDGRRLATFSWDRSAKVFSTKTWEELASFQHRDLVVGGTINSRGSHIATAAANGEVRILPVDDSDIRRQAERRISRRLTHAECQRYSGSECRDLRE